MTNLTELKTFTLGIKGFQDLEPNECKPLDVEIQEQVFYLLGMEDLFGTVSLKDVLAKDPSELSELILEVKDEIIAPTIKKTRQGQALFARLSYTNLIDKISIPAFLFLVDKLSQYSDVSLAVFSIKKFMITNESSFATLNDLFEFVIPYGVPTSESFPKLWNAQKAHCDFPYSKDIIEFGAKDNLVDYIDLYKL